MLAKLIIAGTVGALIGAAAVVATAAPELNLRGGRFKPPTYAELTADQKAYVDREIAAGRTPGPGGPSNINLRSPEMAELERPLTEYLRFKSPMQRKLKEIAVMLTARFWGGQYVWYSHRQQALAARQHERRRGRGLRLRNRAAADPAGQRRQFQEHG
jgi:4-carboxymuconolactone decarboxylase